MCNPVPGGLPRVVPDGGDTYDGVYLPGGVRHLFQPLQEELYTLISVLDKTSRPHVLRQPIEQTLY